MTAEQQYTPQIDANDILFGGGSSNPAIKFDVPGVEQGGRIVSKPQARQEREYDPRNPGKGALKFFPSGDPIMGIVVDVQTTERTDAEDTGVRRIYVEGKRIKDAVRQAVIDSGASGLEVGGELYVAFTGFGEASGPGVNAPKLYQARYVPASAAAANQALGVTGQATNGGGVAVNAQTGVVTQPGQQLPPVQQNTGQPLPPQPAAPVQNGPTPEQIANLQAAGINPATVFPGWTPQQA